ncbi:MAG: molybdopterin cofactor-binding domain-containing protein, partial [Bryobacteraceae bacterium]
MPNEVTFFLNGRQMTLSDPAPDLLLIDYLRSPGVGLAGPKKSCGQGGCGACTVILSHWDGKKPEHRAINSCLRPVCALGGLSVTTIEGTGSVRRPNPQLLHYSLVSSRSAAPPSAEVPPALVQAAQAAGEKRRAVLKSVHEAIAQATHVPLVHLAGAPAVCPSEVTHEGVNPVAYRLALNNGSQCGYCSVGFVMNMSEFLLNNPAATKKEIEDAFDGNICRCTGYRSILTGMKTFASNWTEEDEKHRMKCLEDPTSAAQLPGPLVIPFPPGARGPAEPVTSYGNGQSWRTPQTLAELAAIMHENRGGNYRLVHGNTSFGVYESEFPTTKLFIDIRLIPGLNDRPSAGGGAVRASAGTTYGELISLLESAEGSASENTRIGAALFMARRTAGRIVRNAASLGGNTMMVLKHIAAGTGEPFPSDLFTTLDAIGARINYLELDSAGNFMSRTATVSALLQWAIENPALLDNIVLVSYELPAGDPASEVALAQKVALREVNAHSIVNATSLFTLSPTNFLTEAALVFGGIAPYPWHAARTEAALKGRALGLAGLSAVLDILATEVGEELKRWEPRMKGVPSEGFTAEYRIQLATGLLYKAIVNAMEARGISTPPEVASSGLITWGKWPDSHGRQYWVKHVQDWKKPVGQPYIKVTAMYQTSGQIHYTQELPVPPLTVNAAFVQSRRALANYHFVIPPGMEAVTADRLRRHLSERFSSFVDLITWENIREGGVNYQGMALDQALFAKKMVCFVGQSIALAVANSEQEAIRIARYVMDNCLGWTPVDWPAPFDKPILDLERAIEIGSVFPDTPKSASFVSHIWKIARPGSQFEWTRAKEPLDRAPIVRECIVDGVNCLVVEHAQSNGGQAHFYMETQACVAEPSDERRFIIHPSTQSPMEMHQTAAMALGIHYNQVEIKVNSVGGGFGGKTEQTRFVTGPAAVAAQA